MSLLTRSLPAPQKAQHHTFWLFPILAAGRAKQLAAALRREGVDASTGSSQIGVVRGEGGGTGEGGCPQAVEIMRDVVYVPVTNSMPAWRVQETARCERVHSIEYASAAFFYVAALSGWGSFEHHWAFQGHLSGGGR